MQSELSLLARSIRVFLQANLDTTDPSWWRQLVVAVDIHPARIVASRKIDSIGTGSFRSTKSAGPELAAFSDGAIGVFRCAQLVQGIANDQIGGHIFPRPE